MTDPLALQNIFVKEQDIYEETSVFIEYVMQLAVSYAPSICTRHSRNNKIIFGEGLVATVGKLFPI